MVELDPDLALRQPRPPDGVAPGLLVPRGRRISFGSLQRGIHRPKEMRGPAALSLMTAPPVRGKPRPYDDAFEPDGPVIYRYRAGSIDQPDNRALRAAHEHRTALIYFFGIAPGQYMVVAPVFVVEDRPRDRMVVLEVGVPLADTQPGGPISTPVRAYQHKCTICAIRERDLVQTAHIVADRNLLGIDPDGVVHIARRVREERDGPMLREGIQGFHGAPIRKPRSPADHPDPERLGTRFARFESSAA